MWDNNRRGQFIVFEGPDGSGKTTQARRLYDNLLANKRDVIITREPGGCQFSEQVRELVLMPKKNPIDVKTELMLMMASRIQHVKETIEPALARGTHVICDRFVGSSVVYQGFAGDLGVEFVEELCRWATEGLSPHLTIFTRCSFETSMERKRERGGDPDAMESKDVEFQRLLHDGYRMIEEKVAGPRKLIVDETMSIQQAEEYILSGVLKFLKLRL